MYTPEVQLHFSVVLLKKCPRCCWLKNHPIGNSRVMFHLLPGVPHDHARHRTGFVQRDGQAGCYHYPIHCTGNQRVAWVSVNICWPCGFYGTTESGWVFVPVLFAFRGGGGLRK